MKYDFDYSSEKDSILRVARGIGFQDIIEAMSVKENVLGDIDHFNKKKYPKQRIYIIKISK